jgi:hypothetical protein
MNGDGSHVTCPQCGSRIPVQNQTVHMARCSRRGPRQDATSGGPSTRPAVPSSTAVTQPRRRAGARPAAPVEVVDVEPDNTERPTPERQRQPPQSSPEVTEVSVDGWSCSACTYLNEPTAVRCEMCNQPSSRRPPDPRVRERLIVSPERNQLVSAAGGGIMEDAMAGALLGGVTGGIMGAMRGDARGFLGSVMQGALLGGGAATLLGAQDRRYRTRLNQQRTDESPMVPGMTSTRFYTATLDGSGAQEERNAQMEALMQQFAMAAGRRQRGGDNSGNDYETLLAAFGAPEARRASNQDIASLPTSRLTEADVTRLPEDRRSCCICMEEFKAGDCMKRLPCLHIYHQNCVDEWLRSNGSCPICKHAVGNNSLS